MEVLSETLMPFFICILGGISENTYQGFVPRLLANLIGKPCSSFTGKSG